MKKLIAVILIVCLAMTGGVLYAPEAYAGNIQPLGLDVKQAANSGAEVLDVLSNSLFREPDTDLGNGFFVQGAMLIEPGDIIIGMNDDEIKSAKDLMDAWPNYRIGSDVEFRFIRKGEENSISIKKSRAEAGVTLGNTKYGVTVVSVSSSNASEAGIQEGDLIIGVNGETVKDPEKLTDILDKYSMNEEVKVDYIHEGTKNVTMVRLQEYDFRICELSNKTYGIKSGDSVELIIIKATGDLSLITSFHWMWRNGEKDEWQEIANNTDMALKMGLRIENSQDEETGMYTSILWADNIKKDATGSYYLKVTDKSKMSVSSGEMKLKVR